MVEFVVLVRFEAQGSRHGIAHRLGSVGSIGLCRCALCRAPRTVLRGGDLGKLDVVGDFGG